MLNRIPVKGPKKSVTNGGTETQRNMGDFPALEEGEKCLPYTATME